MRGRPNLCLDSKQKAASVRLVRDGGTSRPGRSRRCGAAALSFGKRRSRPPAQNAAAAVLATPRAIYWHYSGCCVRYSSVPGGAGTREFVANMLPHGLRSYLSH
eukprot:366568-Chlamydomonas_euryale.AAC.16